MQFYGMFHADDLVHKLFMSFYSLVVKQLLKTYKAIPILKSARDLPDIKGLMGSIMLPRGVERLCGILEWL